MGVTGQKILMNKMDKTRGVRKFEKKITEHEQRTSLIVLK